MARKVFQEEPPLPPSPAQQLQRDREDEGQVDEFWTSLRRLLADKDFLLLLASWSLNVGVYCAVNTLLSQLVLPHHPVRALSPQAFVSPAGPAFLAVWRCRRCLTRGSGPAWFGPAFRPLLVTGRREGDRPRRPAHDRVRHRRRPRLWRVPRQDAQV